MPITMYKNTNYTYSPAPRTTRKKVFFYEAVEMVVNGEANALEIFKQLPIELTKSINNTCRESYGELFENLSSAKQKNVFEMILGTLKILEESAMQTQKQPETKIKQNNTLTKPSDPTKEQPNSVNKEPEPVLMDSKKVSVKTVKNWWRQFWK